MDDKVAPTGNNEWLAEQFEANRPHLRAVAYRMLGTFSEAEDAVQESWLHLSRADTSGVENLGGWLTTVVARVCLDMLRSRKARREESLEADEAEPLIDRDDGVNPEEEVLLADAVGLALLVVLDTLSPAERLAFVLHDLFAVPFEEIAPIVGRSPTTARQLASRARRRVRGANSTSETDLQRQQTVVKAFLAASRTGDFEALLTLLDPGVVFRTELTGASTGTTREVHGAQKVARMFSGRAQIAQAALINGAIGVVVAPDGQPTVVLNLTLNNGKIAEINVTTDPARIQQLNLTMLED